MDDDEFRPNFTTLTNFCPDLQNEMNFANVPGTSTQAQSLPKNAEQDTEEIIDEVDKQCVLSLLAVNKIYMEFVGRLVLRVDRAIERNRELQYALKSQLLSRKRYEDVSKCVNVSLGCYPPYFRDLAGMAPRHNEESIRINEICGVDPLLPMQSAWSDKDINTLHEAVFNSLYEQAIIPLNSRKDLLLEKLKSSGVEDVDNRKSWLDEIERINRRILYLKERPDEEYLRDNYDDVDWAKISATDFSGTRSIVQLKMKWCNELLPSINNSAWTPEEDDRLRDLIRGPWLNWDVIADELGTGRTAFRCFERSKQIRLKKKGTWTVEEDEKLESLVETLRVGDEIPWQKIASYIPNRDKKDCQIHYERYLNPKLKHGRWNPEEDLVLLICINKYGPQDWPRIASILQNRSAHQCRNRFITVLDEKRRREPWLFEEHERLFWGIRVFGRRNSAKIALLLPGRNNVDVKNRIRALMRYQIAKSEGKTRKNQAKYRNIMPNYSYQRERYDKVINRFKQFSEVVSHFDKTGQQIDMRMGIGAFLRTPDGQSVDYSLAKQLLQSEFGRFVRTNGRWSSILSNSNEYGEKELERELNKLPLPQQTELRNFLKDSDVRYTIERTREREFLKTSTNSEVYIFYDFSEDESRMARIDELLDAYLPIEADDLLNFHKYRLRPPKQEKADSMLEKLSEKVQQKVAAAKANNEKSIMPEQRKRRAPTALMVESSTPKRCLTASCRFFEEVRRTIIAVPPEDRRMCIICNICDYIRRGDEIENVKRFERGGLKMRGLRFIQEYLAHKVHVDPEIAKKSLHRSIQGKNNGLVTHGDMIRISAETLTPQLVKPSTTLFQNYTLNNIKFNNFPLREVLSNLLPPCISSINAIVLLNRSRAELSLIACRLFDVVDPETLAHRPFKKGDECLDIRLSPDILNSVEYLNLKKRVYRILFLPLLMQKAITARSACYHEQRQAILQRIEADKAFVQAFLKNKELHSDVGDTSSCQVFRTYDNEGAHSLENERAADVSIS